ncbi:MAG: repressor LexA [Candidatus Colwellbacteria bacterium]|nr:repressor LexA [Candidatus Colwellbacteria bacterium]
MKNLKPLTEDQQKVFNFIASHIDDTGKSPTIAEIKEKFNFVSSRSVTQYLEALTKKDLIRRERYKSRGIMLMNRNNNDIVQLPVFASAGCGSPAIIAQRTFDDFISVAASLIHGRKKEDLYVIKAIGTSMNEAGINDGDYLLVERTEGQDINIGDKVVAIIDDSAVVKRYVRSDDLIILQPVSSDKSHKPIILDANSTYKIFGKVLKTIRMPKTNGMRYIEGTNY